ncbi:MAG: MBOAT family protein [Clostridiales bacterium]|nr:MBOAT family protein [Clostridiales bacterium]
MLFSSITFLFYFLPVAILLYYACAWSRKVQNGILFVLSLMFYAWGEPKYVLIMIGSILFNYLMGIGVHCCTMRQERKHARSNGSVKKLILVLTIIGNVGILCLFKYSNFLIRITNEALEGRHQFESLSIVLPLGISFFTLQAMSYVFDVYRGVVPVLKNPFTFGLFVCFFPKLVAGPIISYESMREQIYERKETFTKFSVGCCRFIVGLSKKLLIANQMAMITEQIFELQTHQNIPMLLAWLGAFTYALQIYYDFSGYSDMAIGLSLMFGFMLPENFNYPYISKSVSEFWRRWHISLGNWFKEYVYIPMGGSRGNTDQLVRNLCVLWLLIGIWHGAEWTFIFWGIYNFIFIIIEKLLHVDKKTGLSPMYHVYTILVTTIGWVIFCSDNLVSAGSYFTNMFTLKGGFLSSTALMFLRENFVFFVLGILFCMPIARNTNEHIMKRGKGTVVLSTLYPFAMIGLLFICITYLVNGTYHPFIYYFF